MIRHLDPLLIYAGFDPHDPMHHEGIDPCHGVGSIINVDYNSNNIVQFPRRMEKIIPDNTIDIALKQIEESLPNMSGSVSDFEQKLLKLKLQFRKSTGASILWKDFAEKDETPIEFIYRVYLDELSGDFTQRDLNNIDSDLYAAFHRHCHYHGIDTATVLPRAKRGPKRTVGAGDTIQKPTKAELATQSGRDRLRLYNAERKRLSRTHR